MSHAFIVCSKWRNRYALFGHSQILKTLTSWVANINGNKQTYIQTKIKFHANEFCI